MTLWCEVRLEDDNGKFLDIEGGSSKKGTRLILYERTNKENQLFELNSKANIIPFHCRSKCLDVVGGVGEAGASVVLWATKHHDVTNQRWCLSQDGQIVSELSGGEFCLGAASRKIGEPIVLVPRDSAKALRFFLLPCEIKEESSSIETTQRDILTRQPSSIGMKGKSLLVEGFWGCSEGRGAGSAFRLSNIAQKRNDMLPKASPVESPEGENENSDDDEDELFSASTIPLASFQYGTEPVGRYVAEADRLKTQAVMHRLAESRTKLENTLQNLQMAEENGATAAVGIEENGEKIAMARSKIQLDRQLVAQADEITSRMVRRNRPI